MKTLVLVAWISAIVLVLHSGALSANAQYSLDGGGCGCTLETWNATSVIEIEDLFPETFNSLHSWQYSPIVESATWYGLTRKLGVGIREGYSVIRFNLTGGPSVGMIPEIVYTRSDLGIPTASSTAGGAFAINYLSRPAPGPVVLITVYNTTSDPLTTEIRNRIQVFSYDAGGTTFIEEGSQDSTSVPAEHSFNDNFINTAGTRVFSPGFNSTVNVWNISSWSDPSLCAEYYFPMSPDPMHFTAVMLWYQEGILFFLIDTVLYVVDVESTDPCTTLPVIATLEILADLGIPRVTAKMHPTLKILYIGGAQEQFFVANHALVIVTFNDAWIPQSVETVAGIRNDPSYPISFQGWNNQIIATASASGTFPVLGEVSLWCIRENSTDPELITTVEPDVAVPAVLQSRFIYPQFNLGELSSYGWTRQDSVFVTSPNFFPGRETHYTGTMKLSFCGDGIENTEREGEWPESCVEGLQCDYPELTGTGNATCCNTDTCQALSADVECESGECCIVELPVGVGMNLDTGSCGGTVPSNETICRNSTGPCELDTYYNGINCACPPIPYLPDTTICSPSSGICQTNATCTGNNATCPPNEFRTNTTECLPEMGCNEAAFCPGDDVDCPSPELFPNGTVCNAGEDCQAPSVCEGEPTCPVGQLEPAGTPCGSLTTLPYFCSLQGECNGISPECQGGGPKPAGTPCIADGDPCHISECNAEGVCIVVSENGCIDPVLPILPNDTMSDDGAGTGTPVAFIVTAALGFLVIGIFICCCIAFVIADRRRRGKERRSPYSSLNRENL
jgi:hypothetical protein